MFFALRVSAAYAESFALRVSAAYADSFALRVFAAYADSFCAARFASGGQLVQLDRSRSRTCTIITASPLALNVFIWSKRSKSMLSK